MKIAVLAGGLSTERDVSLITGREVCKALRKKGHAAVLIDLFLGFDEKICPLDKVFESEDGFIDSTLKIGQKSPDLEEVKKRRPHPECLIGPNVIKICQMADLVFLGLHGGDGENGRVQAALDVLGIHYTGSGYLGSAIGMDKGMFKKIILEAGIRTAQGFNVTNDTRDLNRDKITYPCVVKPCCGGSSVGVSIVKRPEDYDAALDNAFRYEPEAVVEEYVKGREFSKGVVCGRALPAVEIIPNAEFYDYETKYQAGMATEVCPADISPEVEKKMERAALEVVRVLKLSDYARVDFLLKGDEPYVLEVNTLPGMTGTSLIPREAKACGISYEDLCQMIVESAAERYKDKKMHR
ncbi:MAG: D-alanine--D-alanine ligase [Lachnospiraceae bacterium]|nr:D-alanine--D-alanine ligase [Lachnospiraceae bacterium]MEE3461074.1 D-alanine--D-alanine ligase [Lachnospiraceae bacterium]